jgi:GNAT superfamily N-acetyltransferase
MGDTKQAGKVTVRVLTNRAQGFYALMGPFLARREIVADLGGHLWDDDDKTWFIATSADRKTVYGFCAARPAARGRTAYLSAYVLPDYRRQGVYRQLWDARRERFPGPAQATCTAASLPLYLAAGWTVSGQRGAYRRVVAP